MGDFRIEVKAVGGHGCQREVKDGGDVHGCGQMGCPDCIAREFVATLQRKGNSVNSATLTHWPGQAGEVVDDLLTKKRRGSF
jgi:hypothetical protein